jgi:hypothetical protein
MAGQFNLRETTFDKMISLAIYYANNMSLWLDLAILLNTLPGVKVQLPEAPILDVVDATDTSDEKSWANHSYSEDRP